ncbi:hypothetical protein DFP73DRAFT_135658 [Morchella snyderi]|nr:hypothetical protein DFP73DRAFT_135658 [Morchella snyderi]
MSSTTSSRSPTPVPTLVTIAPPTIHLDSPQSSSKMATMASPPSSPGPQPSPVFAPRPMRMPQLFRPRPLVALESSSGNQMRTPSPKQQRRSSSAAGGMKSLVLTDSKLVGGETSEVQVRVDDGEGSSNGATGDLQPVQLYSPSKDVLDELYKIIRNNKPQPKAFDHHRRQLSDASSSKDSSGRDENTRSPLSHEFGRIPFPSSPVSRTLMRNPIIYNSQFGQEQH